MTTEDEVAEWLKARAIPLHGLKPATGTADLAPFRVALDGVRVVGLGEATHGSREFFLIRHRLLEFLVEELGFTTLALEASASASRAVDDYVQGGSGDPVEALAGSRMRRRRMRGSCARAPTSRAGRSGTRTPHRP